MGSKIGSAALLLGAGLLGGCAHTIPPGPPPLLTLDGHDCARTPDIASAKPLAFDPKGAKETQASIDETAPCLDTEDGKSLYVVFSLPQSDAPYTVDVASTPFPGGTLFAPRVRLYGVDGSLKREISGSAIVFRGSALSALFLDHADERYLMVASDPKAVGQTSSQIRDITTAVSGAVAGAGFVAYYSIHSGDETKSVYTYAHNGQIVVTLTPLPSK